MSDYAIDKVTNGFIVNTHQFLSHKTLIAPTIGESLKLMLSDMFENMYYEEDEKGTPSEEWLSVMDGLGEFMRDMMPDLMAKWRARATEDAKQFDSGCPGPECGCEKPAQSPKEVPTVDTTPLMKRVNEED